MANSSAKSSSTFRHSPRSMKSLRAILSSRKRPYQTVAQRRVSARSHIGLVHRVLPTDRDSANGGGRDHKLGLTTWGVIQSSYKERPDPDRSALAQTENESVEST